MNRVTAIDVQDLERVYGSGNKKVRALKKVSLTVMAGQFIAIKGRSGSGKTTLLNCLGGLDKPTSGKIFVFGQDLTQLNDDQLTKWRREEVGFIFQSFGLLPTLSAFENVDLMLRLNKMRFRERRQRVMHCLDLVGLKKWETHRPYELSGGQQQRLAIARAIATRPKLILADEPTGELDTETSAVVLALFQEIIKAEELTIFASTHDSLVDEYVNNVLQLHDGEILEEKV